MSKWASQKTRYRTRMGKTPPTQSTKHARTLRSIRGSSRKAARKVLATVGTGGRIRPGRFGTSTAAVNVGGKWRKGRKR